MVDRFLSKIIRVEALAGRLAYKEHQASRAETLLALLGAVGLGVVIATQSPQTSVLALLGIAGLLLTVVRPVWVLLLLPLAVPFGELRTVTIAGLPAGGVEALLVGVSLAWLALGLAAREVRLPRAPLLIPFVIFLGALLLSVPGAASPIAALKEVAKWSEALVAYVLVLAFAETAGPRRPQFIVALVVAVGLAATLEALSGIAQSVLRLGPPSYAILGGRLWRAFGEFGQPNPFGGFINMTLLPALSGVVGVVLGGGGRRSSPILFGVTAILGGALVLSWSRGAWLGAALGALVVVMVWLALTLGWPTPDRAEAVRRRAIGALWALLLAALILTLAGAANIIPTSVTARFGTVSDYFGGFDVLTVEVTDENFAVVERVAHWYAAVNMWADHVWTGVGAGNYATAYDKYRVPRWTDPLGHAHNYYLNIGAEAGLLGLLAYLTLMGAAMIRALQVALRRREWAPRSLAIGVLAMLVAVGVHHLFDNLYVHSMGVYVAILLGLVDSTDARPG